MGRLARVTVPGMPHHVTQRGNRRQQTFFSDADYSTYVDLLSEWCGKRGVAIWAYALLPNHVHLIAVPAQADSLRRGIGEAHRRYSRHVNVREGWRGHLFQGRFASYPMDEPYLLAATRYVELNLVRAWLAERPEDWPFSSARAHLRGEPDRLLTREPLASLVGDWRGFLAEGVEEQMLTTFRRHERTGRPLGDAGFLARLERLLGRPIQPRRAGRKRKEAAK